MPRTRAFPYILGTSLLTASILLAAPSRAQTAPLADSSIPMVKGLTARADGSGAFFVAKVSGSGRPIILIPGLSSSGATFDGTVDHLKGTYECHVLTLAGFAGVPVAAGETEGHMLAGVEDALAHYIREKHLQRPILIGHSLGGFVVLQFAERYPELSGDLVIVDALPFTGAVMLQAKDVETARPAAEGMHAAMANMPQQSYEAAVRAGTYTRNMVTSDADFQKIVEWGLGTDRKVAAEAMYELLTTDARPQLGSISGRVLVLGTWAGYGGATKDAVQQVFETQYRGTQHLQLVMAGQERHFIMLDNPAWFNQQLDNFLQAGAEQYAAQ